MRLINAEALKKCLEKERSYGGVKTDEFDKGYDLGVETAIEMLDNAPTVSEDYDTGYQDGLEDGLNDIKPQGEWLVTKAYPRKVYCSECCKTYTQENHKEWEDGSLPRNFCPNCGIDMRNKGENRNGF